jgi:glyoxylase-like metal-dependent hydrolase (beta-lactamase superfamily II)
MIPAHREKVSAVLRKFQVVLPGVPVRTSRGWVGYCSVVLFRLPQGWALYDTGHFADRSQLLDQLRRARVAPAEIACVILSHLHFDHVLNLSLFPAAEVVVSRAELEYAEAVTTGRLEDPAVPDFWQAILKGRRLQLVEEHLELDGGIQLETLAGHTPGGLVMFCEGPTPLTVCGDLIKNAWEAVTGAPAFAGAVPEEAGGNIRRVTAREGILIPGHDRPFVFSGAEVNYLMPFSWEVFGNFYPRSRDERLTAISLPAGKARHS